MGKQYNKVEKRKRRKALLARRKVRLIESMPKSKRGRKATASRSKKKAAPKKEEEVVEEKKVSKDAPKAKKQKLLY